MNAPRDLLDRTGDAGPAVTAVSLLDRARARVDETQGAYAGAVTPAEAWTLFSAGIAHLVDVRTDAEVHYVGRVPGARHVEWHGRDPQQVERFMAALDREAPRARPLLLLCRSGVRSHHAATEAARRGWQAFNVLEGFEGQRDPAQQRGRIDGWRFHGLPWEQD